MWKQGNKLQVIGINKEKVDDGETNNNLSGSVSNLKVVMPRYFEDQMWNYREKEESGMTPRFFSPRTWKDKVV